MSKLCPTKLTYAAKPEELAYIEGATDHQLAWLCLYMALAYNSLDPSWILDHVDDSVTYEPELFPRIIEGKLNFANSLKELFQKFGTSAPDGLYRFELGYDPQDKSPCVIGYKKQYRSAEDIGTRIVWWKIAANEKGIISSFKAIKFVPPPSTVIGTDIFPGIILTPDDQVVNTTNCPNCKSIQIMESFKFMMGDKDCEFKEKCINCGTPVFYKKCINCGANNRSVNFCRRCNESLGSISDIESSTILMEGNELDLFEEKYSKFFSNIAKFTKHNDATIYIPNDIKQKAWNKLSYEIKIKYYNQTDKSYPPDAFNPNDLLTLFDQLKIHKDYYLDYRYEDLPDVPLVYLDVFAKKHNSRGMTISKTGNDEIKDNVLDVITYENTPMGILQYILFHNEYDKFYPVYIGTEHYIIILTRAQYNILLHDVKDNVKVELLNLLFKQDIRPRVNIYTDRFTAVLLTYDSRHGFALRKFEGCSGSIDEIKYEQLAWLEYILYY